MTDRLNRRGFLAASLATGGLVLAAPGALRAATGGTLRFGLSAYPPSFDMWASTGTAAATVKLMIHRGLLGYDDKGQLTGELAESWDVDKDGVWTFKLRKATWHDGSPVTSADVKYSIEQMAAPDSTAYYRGQMGTITKIDTPDDLTVKLTTKAPTATIPVWFAHYNMPILKKGEPRTSTLGAGPFKFVKAERGQKISVTAYDKFYRQGEPKVKGIDAIVYSDENLRVAALEAGDVDIIEYVPWAAMDRIEKNGKLKLDTVPGPFMYLTFNGSKPPFDNPLVRQAVAIAIKRSDVVAAAFYGHGAPLNHLPIDKSSPYYNADLADSWKYDMQKAKDLLAKAGHPNGFSCTMLSTAQYGMHQQTAEVSQAYLSMIGINVKLDLPDWSTRVEKGNKGEYDIAVMGTAADSNDPDGLATVLDGSQGPSFNRSYKLPTPEITKLLQQGRETFDKDARKKIYHEMEAQVMKTVPAVFLCSRSQGYGLAENVAGFVNLPGQLTFYSGLTLSETALG
ncbi:ABC transporter substrate-binding protein [Acidimangrovimonas sediminis]|uniref:ABC transporter substrate-binding protein n=1 Tax=Acidimangrovimonas sediminis TaxID=2056283 RepID=UPI000C7F8404|nr:ABC transporter substrate-binding protein [Acidimangrovimonas sediminis]